MQWNDAIFVNSWYSRFYNGSWHPVLMWTVDHVFMVPPPTWYNNGISYYQSPSGCGEDKRNVGMCWQWRTGDIIYEFHPPFHYWYYDWDWDDTIGMWCWNINGVAYDGVYTPITYIFYPGYYGTSYYKNTVTYYSQYTYNVPRTYYNTLYYSHIYSGGWYTYYNGRNYAYRDLYA